MPESPDHTPDGDRSEADAGTEIARSLGSAWQRSSGSRPKSTSVEIGKDVVRCVIEEGAPGSETHEDGDGLPDSAPTLDGAGFELDASAAIARVMGRRVIAFIPTRDENAGTSRQTFILDVPRRRY